tara:strand:- start:251 stop:718 length:468 start_codon:yes stop_codon:yes gene_type:complete
MMTSGLTSSADNKSQSGSTTLEEMTSFLDNESSGSRKEPWNKLSKTLKYRKIAEYMEVYNKENELTDEDLSKLSDFLMDCIFKKKLNKVKDVTYNKETGQILNIPVLIYNKNGTKFSLKATDKKRIPHTTTAKASIHSSDDPSNIPLSDVNASIV